MSKPVVWVECWDNRFHVFKTDIPAEQESLDSLCLIQTIDRGMLEHAIADDEIDEISRAKCGGCIRSYRNV